ncbi:MAG: helix-turn-helix transcriptional regulator [Bacilli bacterium]|jgi:transcriptional regulator with XRE-family HTH domain|nr:helix-turn-helix transcriptional regulator [Bacilli bacterium]
MYKEKLKTLRENNSLTLQDISKLLNFEKDTYGKYEREYTTMPLKHLNTLCNYFNVSLDYIFNFNNIPNYENSQKEINKKLAGIRLKEFRKDNKLTQVKLAEILNTVHTVITNYENGKNLISTPFLYDICKKYNISADYLLGKIDDPKYFK